MFERIVTIHFLYHDFITQLMNLASKKERINLFYTMKLRGTMLLLVTTLNRLAHVSINDKCK